MADKITYYSQWTWQKWVVPYRLWRLFTQIWLSQVHSQLSEIMQRCLGAPHVWGCGEPEATKPSTVHAGHIVYVYVSGVCM